MIEPCQRIRALRTQYHLSQEYVAHYLGLNRASFTQIENGHRKVTADEAVKLSRLFCVSADHLVSGDTPDMPSTAFAHRFEDLDEADQEEIVNMIRFKEKIKRQKVER